MSKSTNIHGLIKLFENSTYSHFFHTIAPLSPSSLLSMVAVISSIQAHHCLSYIHLPHALLSSFKPYAARSFFQCVQTITAHFYQLYSRLSLNFSSSSHLSISLFMYIIISDTCKFSKVNKVKSPIWSEAISGESSLLATVCWRNY